MQNLHMDIVSTTIDDWSNRLKAYIKPKVFTWCNHFLYILAIYKRFDSTSLYVLNNIYGNTKYIFIFRLRSHLISLDALTAPDLRSLPYPKVELRLFCVAVLE